MTRISESEWEIMRVLWTKGRTGSTEISALLSEKCQWSSSTIKTMLSRLLEKGYISRERNGKAYDYIPLFEEDEAIQEQVDSLFGRICQRKHVSLISKRLKDLEMTNDDIKLLKSLLDAKETVAEVPCDCIKGQCLCHEEVKEND